MCQAVAQGYSRIRRAGSNATRKDYSLSITGLVDHQSVAGLALTPALSARFLAELARET